MRLFPGLPYCMHQTTAAASRQQAAGSRSSRSSRTASSQWSSQPAREEGQMARGTAAKAYVADVERIAP